MQISTENKTQELKRIIGLTSLTFYGVGMILGAGIYAVIGKAAAHAGESLWLSFIFAGICALFTGLSYSELAAMHPRVGAEYTYMRLAFSKQQWVATICGLMMIIAAASTAATVAIAFAGYLATFINIDVHLVAISLVLFFAFINILGIKESNKLNIVFTLLEILGLLLFIYLGSQRQEFGEALFSPLSKGTLQAAALIMFAYFGFENIVNFAEETKSPEKTIPKAILLSLGISALIYFLVSLSALAIMPVSLLAKSNAPLYEAIVGTSPKVAKFLGSMALFSTANTVLISLLTGSRTILGMSRDRKSLKWLSHIHQKRGTPWSSTLVLAFLAILLIPAASLETVATISSFATLLIFILVNVVVIKLRIQKPDIRRPYKIPFSVFSIPATAVLAIIISVYFVSLYCIQLWTYGLQ